MTWRAFFIGLVAVIVIAAVTPYNDIVVGGTYITGNHFPAGAFFILLGLVVVLNVVLKWVRRAWALRHAELMLVWCMMIVASTVPASGLMRYWFPVVAAPSYYGQRADLQYTKDVLPLAPADLLLAKDPRSVAARRFFEGTPSGEQAARAVGPLGPSAGLLGRLHPALLPGHLLPDGHAAQAMGGRGAADLSAGTRADGDDGGQCRGGTAAGDLQNRAFRVGVIASLAFGLVRIAPVLTGAATGWTPSYWVQSLLWGTPIAQLQIGGIYFFPMAVGFAFLVPADVALSVWLFFLFTRMELLTAGWMGQPIAGGTFSPFMAWQQAGAFIIFTLMMFWAARRHLCAVVRKAFGAGAADRRFGGAHQLSRGVLGAGCLAGGYGGVVRLVHLPLAAHGGRRASTQFGEVATTVPVVLLLLALVFSVVLVHARLIGQGGIFFTQQTWQPTEFLQGVTHGAIFSPQLVVAAQMQNAILITDSREILSGHAVNALKDSSLFERHRRLFLPIMMVCLIVSMGVSGKSIMDIFYSQGALNTKDKYASTSLPQGTFTTAHKMISNPSKAVPPQYGALALGAAVMFVVTVMRIRFYWWPHPLAGVPHRQHLVGDEPLVPVPAGLADEGGGAQVRRRRHAAQGAQLLPRRHRGRGHAGRHLRRPRPLRHQRREPLPAGVGRKAVHGSWFLVTRAPPCRSVFVDSVDLVDEVDPPSFAVRGSTSGKLRGRRPFLVLVLVLVLLLAFAVLPSRIWLTARPRLRSPFPLPPPSGYTRPRSFRMT